jgi:hypothetical protein
MSQRRFDLEEKDRINKNLKLRKKEVFFKRDLLLIYIFAHLCLYSCLHSMSHI